MKNIRNLPEWQALTEHYTELKPQHMRQWFAEDALRSERFSLQAGELFLDYSRNRILAKTINLLCDLANALDLSQHIEALFTGQLINTTEKRAALHTALRDPHPESIFADKHSAQLIHDTQKKMRDFVECIQQATWRGVTGKPIEHIVNIGMGGSHTGPMMSVHALKAYAANTLSFHFISSIDKNLLNEVLQEIDLERTLFIISSKSFTTVETLTNAKTLISLMQNKFAGDVLTQHFIAVTHAKDKALALGLSEKNIFPLWDWVGGRYSIWSAIGLPLMLMIGAEHFTAFLQGAYEMDQHFRQRDFANNMPVLLALFNIWYLNFYQTTAHAIVPYAHALRYLIPYLQQAEMESNGKRIKLNGTEIDYMTSPVVFGEEGCHSQHSFHQLLHQSPQFIPVDFILIGQTTKTDDIHQDTLLASALAQAHALMKGKTYEEALEQLLAHNMPLEEAEQLAYHQTLPGNRPCNILYMQELTPKNLGALLALYEHKIYVQSTIWGINCFDQWGVELGKQLLPGILQRLQNQQQRDFLTLLNVLKHEDK